MIFQFASDLPVFQAENSCNDGGRIGSMASSSSSNFLTRYLKFSDTRYRNHSIVGKDSFNHFNYGVNNLNFESTINSNILPKNVTFSPINNNPFRFQSNNRSREVGIETINKEGSDNASVNRFGLNFTDQKENMNFRSCMNEKLGLVHGGFGFNSISEIRGVSGNEFNARLS